jgi:Transglutaminase-like superfamily
VAQYWLTTHTFLCSVDDGVMFLNLKTHRYFGLGSRHCEALGASISGWPLHNSQNPNRRSADAANRHELIDLLKSRGLLTSVGSLGKPASEVQIQADTSLDFVGRTADDIPITFRNATAFASAVCLAAAQLRFFSLEQIIRMLRRRGHPGPPGPVDRSEADVRRLVALFRRLATWTYTTKDACLFDSLALVLFLRHFHVRAQYVIGVRTKPFRAHCWAQMGTRVLNATLEQASEFTPILTA